MKFRVTTVVVVQTDYEFEAEHEREARAMVNHGFDTGTMPAGKQYPVAYDPEIILVEQVDG